MTIFSIFQAFCFCTSLCFETLIFDDRLVSMFVLSRVVRFFHHIKLWANYQYNADRVFVKSAIWSGPYKVLLKSPAIILITLSEKSEIKKVRSTLINNDKLYFKGRNFRDYWFSGIFFPNISRELICATEALPRFSLELNFTVKTQGIIICSCLKERFCCLEYDLSVILFYSNKWKK